MAYYYNPYSLSGPSMSAYQSIQPMFPQQAQPMQYMINVDGEAAAKSWQAPTVPQPNSIIPLFDLDGQHVYFKSYDAYGRLNPLRKGTIVFEDEVQQVSTAPAQPSVDMSKYVMKDDLKSIYQEIKNLRTEIESSKNQNNQNGSNFRGEKR